MMSSPFEPLKLDWAAYKNKIAIPGLVDNFEKSYNAIKVPYPEDKYTAAIDKHEKQIVISIIFKFLFVVIYINQRLYVFFL